MEQNRPLEALLGNLIGAFKFKKLETMDTRYLMGECGFTYARYGEQEELSYGDDLCTMKLKQTTDGIALDYTRMSDKKNRTVFLERLSDPIAKSIACGQWYETSGKFSKIRIAIGAPQELYQFIEAHVKEAKRIYDAKQAKRKAAKKKDLKTEKKDGATDA